MSSWEITHRLGEFEIDIAMTYVDDDELGNVRVTPLYDERYLLLTPNDGEFAARARVRWSEAASLPLCLLTPRSQLAHRDHQRGPVSSLTSADPDMV